MNFDEIIAKIVELRDKMSELNAQLDELKEQKAMAEESLMQSMAGLGMTQAGGPRGTATLKQVQKATISDWGAFEQYVIKSGNLSLVQKRISAPAYSELLEAGEEVPGVTVFTQYDVSVRRK